MLSNQTHCSICQTHLRSRGVWCAICGYVHTKCSGLSAAKDWSKDFTCVRCRGTHPSEAANSPAVEPLNSTSHPSTATHQRQHLTDELNEELSVDGFWAKVTPEIANQIKDFYNQVVHWKPLFITLPKNKTGHKFVETMDRILAAIAEKQSNENIALYAAMLMPHLVLARTTSEPDASRNKTTTRRLKMWLNGEIEQLFKEAEAVQKRTTKSKSNNRTRDMFRDFDAHMSAGKISNALRSVNDCEKGGVLSLSEKIDNKTVFDILKDKHPPPKSCDDAYVVASSGNNLPYHPVIFDRIQAGAIRRAGMKTHGSHGPSGVDANEWRRWMSNFSQSSTSLCRTVARLAVRIATEEIDNEALMPYNACRLIPLDKNPGVRPIGVGEVLRRIIGRTILRCVENDLKLLGKNQQLCLGQKCGIEHAIHSLRKQFETPETQGILLIDAKNAFNSLNRDLALRNIEKLCPSIITAIRNSYKTPTSLFVNGKTLQSQEGTTQGDPLAMAMYGIAILPLIDLIQKTNITQKWYADDGNVTGSLKDLKAVHEQLKKHGPAFGYTLTKCNIITKTENMKQAQSLFNKEDVEIVDGHRVLGSVIGSEAACDTFRSQKQSEYNQIVEKLSKHAKVSPQNVFHCYTKGLQNKVTFLSRTTPNFIGNLEETERKIKENLIPAITGKNDITDEERSLFSLPVRDGGLNIVHPQDRVEELNWSRQMAACLDNDDDPETQQSLIVKQIRKEKSTKIKEKISVLIEKLDENQRYALDLSIEKGASSWLNTLPLKRYHFDLTKTECRDGLALRYGWEPLKTPALCPCGELFSLSHSLQCNKGGYTQMRHNEIRDTFASVMKEVCYDVEIEPKLQPLESESFVHKTTTTEDEARLDIKANGLWDSRFCRTFFDVKIFNPLARTCPKNVNEAYKFHESQKKLKYESRIINVEKSTFNPLIFACTGGAGPSATKVITRLAAKINEKGSESYADAISYIRTKISFALLRSSVLCLRGCRATRRQQAIVESSISAIVHEGGLS